MIPAPVYLLGHDGPELQRLELQAKMIAGVTRRLIRECGIRNGMRVLDIGCGVGDVSMLLAEAVGHDGEVVAIDRERRAIEAAQARATARGFSQINFRVATDESLPTSTPFDAAFGRYVLIHQRDPVALVRRVTDVVRPGGIIAFHEVALHVDGLTLPTIDLYREINQRIACAYRKLLPTSYNIAGGLLQCFTNAGLPSPRILWESIVGDHRTEMLRCLAMSYFSIITHIERLGLPPLEADDLESLVHLLEEMAAECNAQIVSRPQACAWATRS